MQDGDVVNFVLTFDLQTLLDGFNKRSKRVLFISRYKFSQMFMNRKYF